MMEAGRGSAGGFQGASSATRHHVQQQELPQQQRGSRADITAGDMRDQEQQELLQLSMELPITYMPFKFENRRVRIDWRLLHGVDIDKLIRDTDLDTLEQLVTSVCWGDLEAEDTRHLSEGNFVKVFRLAQLLLEYLLYVQENLKYTNGVLSQSRSAALVHAHSLSARCRDLSNQLKQCKRELKLAHKTVKTFELMAAAVGGAAAAAQAASAAAEAATPTKQESAAAQLQQQQVQLVQQLQAQLQVQQQQLQQQQAGGLMTAGEEVLQRQLSELTERLTLAVTEAERLRGERQELQGQIQHLRSTLANKLAGGNSSSGGSKGRHHDDGAAAEAEIAAAVAAAQREQQQLFVAEMQCAQAQIGELQAQNKELRSQLKQQADAAAAAAAEPSTAELKAQPEEQAEQLRRLQAELAEKEASIKVFQTTNATLEDQLDALQRQLASPEATTPSFVAKQRQQLAAAAAAHAGLQSENMQLREEINQLRVALENSGVDENGSGAVAAMQRAAADGGNGGDDDALVAAERLLSGGGSTNSSPGRSDWKVQEIERLQAENKQLQAKVASLQGALHDLENSNSRLERRLTAAQAAGFMPAPSPQGSPVAAAAAAPAGHTGASASAAQAAVAAGTKEADAPGLTGLAGSGWASVSSSGPAAEITAADLPTAAGPAAAAAEAAPAAAEAVGAGKPVGAAGSDAWGPKVALSHAAGGSNSAQESVIAAYRPSRDGTGSEAAAVPTNNTVPAAAAAGAQAPASSAAAMHTAQQQPVEQEAAGENAAAASSGGASSPTRGFIDQAAAARLKQLVQEKMQEPPVKVAQELEETCQDWDKPLDLLDEEKVQFRECLPLEVQGLKGVLCDQAGHTAEEIAAAKAHMLPLINRALDTQLASFGIHPGRTGLSDMELLAAMKMLGERRAAQAAALTPEQFKELDVLRVGLILHTYHVLQGEVAGLPEGPGGKKQMPEVLPALVSAVRPPASSAGGALPSSPPPIRLQPRAPGPLGSPGGFGGGSAGSAAAAAALGVAATSAVASSPAGSVGSAAYAVGGTTYHHDSPQHSAGGSFSSQAIGGLTASKAAASLPHLRPPSPLGSEAAREAIAKATSTGSFSPMSAALHAKQQLLRSSMESSAAGSPRSVSTGLRQASQGGVQDRGSAGGHVSTTFTAAGSPTASAAGVTAGPTAGGADNKGPGSPVRQGPMQQAQQQQGGSLGAVLPAGVVALSARATPGGSYTVSAGGPAGGLARQQQQQAPAAASSAAASVAMKQYLTTSFDDSDEF